jgi:starch synthase
VDYAEWHPNRDPYITAPFSRDALAGKAACKADLQRRFGLLARPEAPLLAVISRLTPQKGMDLVAEVMDGILDLDSHLVLLGTGDPPLHAAFEALRARHPDRVGLCLGFDVALSHQIEAGADIFVMPSRYEPCGLNQMYSLAYGTIPVVRATGGLDDTIRQFNPETGAGNGFKFVEATAAGLLASLRAAVELYRQPERWAQLVQNAMACDYSWDRSAREYEQCYREVAARRTRRG